MIGLNGQAVAHVVPGCDFIICLVQGARREAIFWADADRKRLKLI
jgi:hypothetical protein